MLPAEITTARLTLRPPRPDDAAAIFARYSSDPEVTRYLTWRPHQSVAQTEQFVAATIAAWQEEARRPWVITRRDEDSPIGMIEARVEGCRAELGYVLSRQAWGQGLMTEAARAVTDLALAELPVYRVWAVCDLENTASARVLQKAGMAIECRLRRYVVHPNVGAEPRDVLLFARTR